MYALIRIRSHLFTFNHTQSHSVAFISLSVALISLSFRIRSLSVAFGRYSVAFLSLSSRGLGLSPLAVRRTGIERHSMRGEQCAAAL